jgi:hypothetical protein
MTLEIEIELCWMGDFTIDNCSSWTISTSVGISFVLREEPDMGGADFEN